VSFAPVLVLFVFFVSFVLFFAVARETEDFSLLGVAFFVVAIF
jgi:hypothetical protein